MNLWMDDRVSVERKLFDEENSFVSGQGQALNIIVGERKVSPCDHAVYSRFKLWVVSQLTGGEVETYRAESVTIDHWDEKAGNCFPHLLNPCECGTFLPIAVEPGPMLSSAVGLLEDLERLKQHYSEMEPDFQLVSDVLLEMAQFSLDTNTPLEFR